MKNRARLNSDSACSEYLMHDKNHSRHFYGNGHWMWRQNRRRNEAMLVDEVGQSRAGRGRYVGSVSRAKRLVSTGVVTRVFFTSGEEKVISRLFT